MSKASASNFDTIIECMSDIDMDNHISRISNYTELLNICAKASNLSLKSAETLISVCTKDLTADSKYLSNSINVLNSVLEKIKANKCTSGPYLLPSALAVLNVITLSKDFKLVRQMTLCTLLKYPDDILISVAESHSKDLTSIFDCSFLGQDERIGESIEKVLALLIRVLNLLPQGKRETFIKDGLEVWLKSIIPAVTWPRPPLHASFADNILAIELMTDYLMTLDYSGNPYWEQIVADICETKKYPKLLKSLVDSKSDHWHRLWTIFIKLLKSDITKVRPKSGVSPINALLPVVELAFRLDPLSRCKAFECWRVLIDNFSVELNGSESHILNRRLKLLITPMKLNNAKVNETVLAKLDTWWHLIRKFFCKMDKLTDTVLKPFLNFCFGTKGGTVSVPGQITTVVAVRCVEMFAEIVGHVSCEGCVTVPRLEGRLINTKLLVEHWDMWLHSLMVALQTAPENSKFAICLWDGFVSTISELPSNQIRADLFADLLSTSLNMLLVQNDFSVLVSKITMSGFFTNQKNMQLLKSKDSEGPIYDVLNIVLHAHMNGCGNVTSSNGPEVLAKNLRPLTDFIMKSAMCSAEHIIEWLFSDSVANQSRTYLWSALVDSFIETENNIRPKTLSHLIKWPIRNMNLFSPADSSSSYKWFTLYSFVHPIMLDNKIDKVIMQMLLDKMNTGLVKLDFALSVALAVLRQQLISDIGPDYLKEVKLLLKVLKMTNEQNFMSIKNQISNLIDTLILLVTKIKETNAANEKILENCVGIVNHVLLLRKLASIPPEDNQAFITALINQLGELLLKKKFNNLKTMLDQIVEIHVKSKEPDTTSNFPKPEPKVGVKGNVPTKSKKKVPNIVNTSVLNGEEYVVVKSNWKFDLKKLTENQKEKFKRKREDIPALYQDLSQSQDEFKLKSWKTDSQDTSNTASTKSNTKSNDDVSKILKNIPSADIVPHIMENIVSNTVTETPGKGNKPHVVANSQSSDKPTEKVAKKLESSPNTIQPKTPKTPRMALKDRVFKNVRNLIEKSGLQPEEIKSFKQITEDANQTVCENNLKTPITKPKDTLGAANSAPPKIALERPSRSIKKPKKFEDLTDICVTRRRRSQSCAQTDLTNICAKRRKRSQSYAQTDSDSSKPSDITEDQSGLNRKTESIEEVDKTDVSEVPSVSEESNVVSSLPVEETVMTAKSVPVTEVVSTEPFQSDEKQQPTKVVTTADNVGIVRDENTPTEVPKDIIDNSSQVIEEIATQVKSGKKKETDSQSLIKKKRSRIEKQLLIDMVEGHPLLQSQSEKRVSRKNQPNDNDTVSKRRKSLIEKSLKIKADLSTSVGDKKAKGKDKSDTKSKDQSTTITDSQDSSPQSQDIPASEDIIESSQDSTLTAISVKSATKKRIPVVALNKANALINLKVTDTQNLLDDFNNDIIPLSDTSSSHDSREDIELPKNKTVEEENPEKDLTENMDTEPIDSSADVIIINDDPIPIVINTEDTPIGTNTLEVAEADTLPMDVEMESSAKGDNTENITTAEDVSQIDDDITHVSTLDNTTQAISGTAESITDMITESSNTGSPLKDDNQRKKDFLNNTIEISPIKTMSPIRDEKSPSSENSSEYVVIKLTSPVNSNGEPLHEKCDSPEIFTEEKACPEKRDQSPPRKPTTPANNSPSSSLSLKKNRPQMWSNGRAAQMLGLCVPEKLQIMTTERSNIEEIKKGSPINTTARRNLRILYNSVSSNENEPEILNSTPPEKENEENKNFLKFQRCLPTADSSPAGPILKRKLADITDEATVSPASKRKRVSFHDPPVSTTVSVQKYIEPCGIRSPSNSATKRQEKQMRSFNVKKSPKRLENVFRLETVLTKAVESFSSEPTVSNETEISLDDTPAVEVIKTSELNDTDPIYPELTDCEDPIENIAGELSSASTKDLLVKELEGKIVTVGDLAKMPELEVNRLCIRAPKIQVAKKVLTDYASRKVVTEEKVVSNNTTDDEMMKLTVAETVEMEVQTIEVPTNSCEMQTEEILTILAQTQTEVVPTAHCSAQTDESGGKSTKDVVATCLAERPDFVEQLVVQLPPPGVQQISEKLPFDATLALLLNKMTASNSTEVLTQILDQTAKATKSSKLNIIQDFLINMLDTQQFISFCRQLFNKYDKH